MATDDDFPGRLDHTIHEYLRERDRGGGESLLDLLRFADLGVTGLEVQEAEMEAEAQAERERLLAALRDVVGDRLHLYESVSDQVRLEHRTSEGTFRLRLGEESSGTRTWIGLLGPVLSALRAGTVLCVDDLDARLHPHMTDALVNLFQSARSNIHGAQMIFSTHEASLLGRNSRTELLRDQIWFTEKDGGTGATRLFPMTEFQVRNAVENLEKRYLAGRYGALPFLDEELLARVVAGLRSGSGVAAEQETGPDRRQAS